MKRFLLPIIAGAMFSTSALSAPSMKIDATNLVLPTGDQVISDLYIQNTGGINNVSLSKYEQAWMIVHEKDTLFKHKTFWVRTGKIFTGISVDDLKDLNKIDRSSAIGDAVKQNLISSAILEQIEMVKKEIIDIQKRFAEVDAKFGQLSADLATKTAELKSLQMAKDAVDQSNSDLEIKLSDKVSHVEMIEARIADLESKLEAAKANYSKGYTNSLVETLRVFKEELVDNGVIAIPSYIVTDDVGSGHLFSIVRQIIEDARNYINVAKQAAKDKMEDNKTPRDFDASPVSLTDDKGTNYNNSIRDGIPSDISVDKDNVTYHPTGHLEYTVTANGIDYSVTFDVSVGSAYSEIVDAAFSSGFDAGYEQGFSEGYDQGYSDGFEDGYEAGYDQGFKDGINSVK